MQNNYKEMYNAIWNYHKKYINEVNNSDEFWNTVRDEALEIGKQYNNHPLIKALIIAELAEFERIMNNNSKEENTEENKPP